jgi:hypothetical protein
MRFLILSALLFQKEYIIKNNLQKKITPIAICKEDYECDLPYRCCEGIIFNYCCFHGGTPAPIPVPIPIPIPIPIPDDTIVPV